ncbi:hypothetical protein SLA2020_525440 [Shorea laevis]
MYLVGKPSSRQPAGFHTKPLQTFAPLLPAGESSSPKTITAEPESSLCHSPSHTRNRPMSPFRHRRSTKSSDPISTLPEPENGQPRPPPARCKYALMSPQGTSSSAGKHGEPDQG